MESYFKIGELVTRDGFNSIYEVVRIESFKDLPDILLLKDIKTGFRAAENENFCYKTFQKGE